MKQWRRTPKAEPPGAGAGEFESAPALPKATRGYKWLLWVRTKATVLLMILAGVLIALIPLYGIQFPPLVDYPEHLLISKLLWEKLAGISPLDLEISWFLAYRLFPVFMVIVLSVCNPLGVPFASLPNIGASALISFHALVVVIVLYSRLKDRSWKSWPLVVCFSLPAIVCMYSASWFIGFVNYTLAITLVVSAVFLTERFLRSGRWTDACLLFLNVLLVYMAHPFAPAFWLLWCASRGLAAIVMRSLILEWKRLILAGLLFLPIVLYHFAATRGTGLGPTSTYSLASKSPFISLHDWYHSRFRGLLDGFFFQADDVADPRLFGRVAMGLIVFSFLVAFRPSQDRDVKKAALSSGVLFLVASWINENFIPVPRGHWLAYDYRFSSTSYAICLAVAGFILIRSLPASTDKWPYKVIFVLLAFVSVFGSVHHLLDVRKAYKRFDLPARKYMAKVFNHEVPAGIYLPHSRYHPDGTFLNNYVRYDLRRSELYPVRLKSPNRVPIGPLVGYWKLDERNRSDACVDSSGNGYVGTPKGTTVIEGKVGRARGFNGTGDYIDIPTISIRDAITVAAWIYSERFVHDGFVVTKNPVNSQWALFFESDGFLKWRGAGFEKNVQCAAPSNHNWHHIVAKQKGTAGSLYVDGVLRASGTLPAIGNASSSISIGRYDTINYHYFDGRIDEVRIYNRALSDTEVLQLFTSSDSKSASPSSSQTQSK